MNRMWDFIFLSIVGLNVFQAAAGGKNDLSNSTQMYYVKLTIEKSAIVRLPALNTFRSNLSLHIDNLQKTTTCKNNSSDKECTCETGYKWSDEVCQSIETCCDSKNCIFPMRVSHMCVSNISVAIKGSVNIKGTEYKDCLTAETSPEFQTCNKKLKNQFIMTYSTLRGFDTLRITKYSFGSVVVDFEMTIEDLVTTQDLIARSETLTSIVSSSFYLETTGIVQLTMPENPVRYNATHTLRCTMSGDNADITAEWTLKNSKESKITNGTVSEMTSTDGVASLHLRGITEMWAGEYICAYKIKSNSSIILHRASAVLDVALLPNIDATTDPGFPRCKTNDDLLLVKGICEISCTNETYNVTWTSQGPSIISFPPTSCSEGTMTYTVETMAACNSSSPNPHLTCTFQNRRQQTRTAYVPVNIIYAGEPFCEEDGIWKEAKPGQTAVLKCDNAHGRRQRNCSSTARWEEEQSECVNLEVNSVLESAKVADSGIGALDENAADVFSRLENVSNSTEIIDTSASMRASVEVLSVLSQKLHNIDNESVVSDFLESSSNFMGTSFQSTWESAEKAQSAKSQGDLSLAETYLTSVEKLIEVANITSLKTKTNIEVAKCSREQGLDCTNTAFNITVTFESSENVSVKTAAFKQLEEYMPDTDEDYSPNSMIVSTTAEKKSLGSAKVKIQFQLKKERPRNHYIKCVWWNTTARQWSSSGCEWKGPSQEELCECNHLSSFASLIAKKPWLIPAITEITYVGLSISIVALIICLAIELTVWTTIVKTDTLYLRHTAHINIYLCLLIGDCCFLASAIKVSDTWCLALAVLKHFTYLSMFFWMLSLSTMLLHKAVFLFHNVSKKIYQRFSLFLGYICPLLIVVITFLTNNVGAEGMYYSKDTCWLIYIKIFHGSIHTFLIPMGIIVFINIFAMLVVLIKLLDHTITERHNEQERSAAKTVMRTVVLLTPIFGVTWIFGFAVAILDNTTDMARVVNYAFVLLNAFQGLFMLFTTCLGDKKTREALRNRLQRASSLSITDSTTKLESIKGSGSLSTM